MSPWPPSAAQVPLFVLNVAPVSGEKTRLAAVTMSLPLQGKVVDWTAPHRAAASTDDCNILQAQMIQATCTMPMMNTMTGRITRAKSTSALPQLFLSNFFILQNPDSRSVRQRHRFRPRIETVRQQR